MDKLTALKHLRGLIDLAMSKGILTWNDVPKLQAMEKKFIELEDGEKYELLQKEQSSQEEKGSNRQEDKRETCSESKKERA